MKEYVQETCGYLANQLKAVRLLNRLEIIRHNVLNYLHYTNAYSHIKLKYFSS